MILKTTLPSVVAAAACWKPHVLLAWGTGNLILFPEIDELEASLKVIHFYIEPVGAGGHYKKDLEHKTVKHNNTDLRISHFCQEQFILLIHVYKLSIKR
jgi:hypothetical protein